MENNLTVFLKGVKIHEYTERGDLGYDKVDIDKKLEDLLVELHMMKERSYECRYKTIKEFLGEEG